MVLRAIQLLSVLVVCTVSVGVFADDQNAVQTASKFVQIPLHRRSVSYHPSERARRLLHQQDRIRRRLGESTENDTDGSSTIVYNEVPLGVGMGTHYAELYLGIPAQRASVIVDTGSHLTAFPCSECQGCGRHTDPLYDMAKSTTARYVTCKSYSTCGTCRDDKCYISQSYTEGSMWSAVVIDDIVWLGGFHHKHADDILSHYGVRFPVGCQTKETGLFITQKENGIMGLGQNKATLLSYMLEVGRIEHEVFAMCFSTTGGGLVLGGIDYSLHDTQIAYTPLVTGFSGWYPVYVKDILVGGKTLGVASTAINTGKGVIVDSGTTDTFFVATAARHFQQLYSDLAGVDYSEDRMDVSADEVLKLPSITIVLQGVKGEEDIALEIPATKYLTKAEDGSYYGNFHFTERSGGVLGASTMVGYDVIFDVENKRVGFAESKCDISTKKNKTPPKTGSKTPEADSTQPSDDKSKTASAALPSTNPTTSTDSNTIEVHSSKTSTKNGSTPDSSSFYIEILLLSVVGVVVVVGWKRLRQRSWSQLEGEPSTRNSVVRILSDNVEDDDPCVQERPSPTRRAINSLSPSFQHSPTARKTSPRFTIGSDSESERDSSP